MVKKALVVVDMQIDFCEGGALAVKGGNEVAARIASILRTAADTDLIVFTMDDHRSNSTNSGHIALPPDVPDFVDTWPPHCIRGTEGWELHPAISTAKRGRSWPTFTKGYGRPSYSGFEGTTDFYNGLAEYLTDKGVTDVAVCGLAADYCVRATALDSIAAGFKTEILPLLTATIATPVNDVCEEIEAAQRG